MKKLMWFAALLLIVSGISCLSISANGPWGFSLIGKYCWLSPFIRMLALVVGVLLLGVAGAKFLSRKPHTAKCSKCGVEIIPNWTICYKCGTILDHTSEKIRIYDV